MISYMLILNSPNKKLCLAFDGYKQYIITFLFIDCVLFQASLSLSLYIYIHTFFFLRELPFTLLQN